MRSGGVSAAGTEARRVGRARGLRSDRVTDEKPISRGAHPEVGPRTHLDDHGVRGSLRLSLRLGGRVSAPPRDEPAVFVSHPDLEYHGKRVERQRGRGGEVSTPRCSYDPAAKYAPGIWRARRARGETSSARHAIELNRCPSHASQRRRDRERSRPTHLPHEAHGNLPCRLRVVSGRRGHFPTSPSTGASVFPLRFERNVHHGRVRRGTGVPARARRRRSASEYDRKVAPPSRSSHAVSHFKPAFTCCAACVSRCGRILNPDATWEVHRH